jgi:hypothetical protein
MVVVIALGLLSMFFAWLESSGEYKHGLKISFILIFLFLALRYNFGNDYMEYLKGFIKIERYSASDFFNKNNYYEPGWIFLCWLFNKSFGFFAMVAVLALLNCLVYYHFIKKFVPKKYYWLAIFIYIFNTSYMLVHSSAMRQSIAIIIFIFSLNYLYKKDAIRYFLCVGIASLFHTSAIILFPVYLISFINLKNYKTSSVVIITIFLSIFIFKNFITPYISLFISSYFERYEAYQSTGISGSGLGVLYYFTLLILILYYERVQNKETQLVFKIAIISFVFIPLYYMFQLIGRIGMYFVPALIVVSPIIAMKLKQPIYKSIFVIALLFMTLYSFFQFFSDDIWKVAFGTYQTIFSASQWY